jgi:hypothetical protein
MRAAYGAVTCRWASPTIFFPPPVWFEAEHRPWTCRYGACPRVLDTTDSCATCRHWEPRSSAGHTEAFHEASAGIGDRIPAPTMMDWFGAFQPPHEAA